MSDQLLAYTQSLAREAARRSSGPAVVIITDKGPQGVDYLCTFEGCQPLDLERAAFTLLAQAQDASVELASNGCDLSLARITRIAEALKLIAPTTQPIGRGRTN